MASTVGKLRAILGLNNKKFNQGLKRSGKQASKFGSQMKKLGGLIAGYLSFQAVIQGARKLITTYASFSEQVSKLSALTGKSKNQLESLTNQAKELGSTTQKTASQVAGLQVELAKKGFNTAQIQAATDGIVNLSIAAGEDLPQSAAIASGVMNAFGMQAEEMGRITDVMAASFSATAMDLTKFQNSMSKVAPVARQVGMSIEETSALLGTLVDSNVEASTASAQLRNILLEVENRGISMAEAYGQILSATNPVTKATEMFGVRAGPIATILAENAEKAKQLTTQYNNASGAAKSMADTMQDNLKGDLDAAQSAVEGLMIEIGTSESGGLRGVVQGFIDAVRGATNNIDGFLAKAKTAIKFVGGLAAAYVAAKTVIVAYETATKIAAISTIAYQKAAQVARAAQIALNTAMKANPIGFIITALTTVGSLVYAAWQRFETFRAVTIYVAKSVAYRFQVAWAAIKVGVKNLFAGVKAYFNAIGNSAKVLWKAVKAVFTRGKSPGEVLRDGFKGVGDDLKDVAKKAGEDFKKEMEGVSKPDYDEILAREKGVQAANEAGEEIGGGLKDGIDKGSGGSKEVLRKRGREAGAAFSSGMQQGMSGGGDSGAQMSGKMEGKGITPFDPATVETELAGIERIKQKTRELNATMHQTGQQSSIVGGIMGNAFQGMQNSISDALKNSKNILQGFWTFFKDFIKGLIIKLVAAATAAAALFALLQAIPGMSVGSLSVASSFKEVFSSVSNIGGGVGLANGGVIPSGYPNDTYPAMLTSGETVTPPGKLPTMGSGGGGEELRARVSGQDLEFVLQKWGKNKNRIT